MYKFWSIALLCCLGQLCNGSARKGTFGLIHDFTISSGAQVEVEYPDQNHQNPYRVHTWSNDACIDYPILVVVRQERRVTSWQLPLLVETSNASEVIEYRNTSRTLCYDSNEIIQKYNKRFRLTNRFGETFERKRNFTVSLSTSSPVPVTVSIFTDVFQEYFVTSDKKHEVKVSPSQPVFYSFSFPPKGKNAMDNINIALVHVTSEDDTCFIVSVQPKICPVRDLNEDITYEGNYQTIKTKGGLSISRRKFPNGFHLVFVARGDNRACSPVNSIIPNIGGQSVSVNNQTTTIVFEIKLGKSLREYIVATMVVLWSNIGICLLFMILTVLFYHFGRFKEVPIQKENPERVLELAKDEIDAYFVRTELNVSDFVKKGRSNRKNSMYYLWHIINIAIFYCLPVVQLMISYQRTVDDSGNLDMCYHNFHCSHPLYFNDFNHIFSNVGYILFGVLFLFITLYKNKNVRNYPDCGIPKFHGLYYAMGFGLIFEGVLSGCYHICPNQSNFQFDTSFMYVMAVLIIVKLYQNRHPDINANAYFTFFVLGIAVTVAMFGILFNSMTAMICFIILYLTLCVYVANEIYFFGNTWRGWKWFAKSYRANEPLLQLVKPVRIGRFVLIIIATLANFGIAIAGLAVFPRHVDFGTFLLGILMANAIMYCSFYIIMKCLCRERICFEAILYGVLGLAFWVSGAYFFMSSVTQWSLTPAESRELNRDCMIMGFYDTHDIWHLLSAPALFFSFMLLLTLDDDLYATPYTKIHAF